MTTTQEIKPGDVIVIRNSGIGDFDPPMTLTVVVESAYDVAGAPWVTATAVYATDFEPYEIDGEVIVSGAVDAIGGDWPVDAEAVVIAHGATV